MRFTKILMLLSAWLHVTGAFDLECSSTHEEQYWIVQTIFTCNVTNMQITKRGEVMESASSVAQIDNVKAVYALRNNISFMPKFATDLGQRLVVLWIKDCHLKEIERDDLRQFERLRYLGLMDNDLESLPGDLLQSTPLLENIDFSGNKLKSVGAHILQPLSNIKRAWFNNSGCINSNARYHPWIETLKLQLLTRCKLKDEINAMRNDVERLEEEKTKLTEKVAQLKDKINELEMKANEDQKETIGEKIKSDELNKKVALLQQKFQSCDQNLISATKTLSPLLTQSVLSFTEETTVEFICDHFENVTQSCNVLDLVIAGSSTKVVVVMDDFGHKVKPTSLNIRVQATLFLPTNLNEAFPDLEHLEVSSSGLFLVNRKTFASLDKLESLNLTSNKISSIGSCSFVDLKLLRLLDLSSNRLESIDALGFDGLKNLKMLNLKDNKLKEITANFLSQLKALNTVDFSANLCIDDAFSGSSFNEIEAAIIENCVAPVEFSCIAKNDHHICEAENLKVERLKSKPRAINGKNCESVTELVVQDQIVKFLPHQIALSFPKLIKLVVSRSQLSMLTITDFLGLTDLKWVEICDNRVDSIEPETFNSVAQLVYLYLSSNHIQSLPPKVFERLTKLTDLRLSINDLKVLKADICSMPNAIKTFKMDNNKLEEFDIQVLLLLRNADEIDLADNTCIDLKYQKTDERSLKAFSELSGAIVLNCVAVDSRDLL